MIDGSGKSWTTDPLDPDTDNDGLTDSLELRPIPIGLLVDGPVSVIVWSDPTVVNTDDDAFDDGEEYIGEWNPRSDGPASIPTAPTQDAASTAPVPSRTPKSSLTLTTTGTTTAKLASRENGPSRGLVLRTTTLVSTAPTTSARPGISAAVSQWTSAATEWSGVPKRMAAGTCETMRFPSRTGHGVTRGVWFLPLSISGLKQNLST